MDLKQRKLSKSEWESIEIPVSKSEIDILKLITNGFHDVNIRINKTDSIFTFLKIEYNQQIEEFLYIKFFADKIRNLVENHEISFIKFGNNPTAKKHKQSESGLHSDNNYYINVSTIVRLKSGDQIRLSRLDTESITEDTTMYEFILYSNLEKMVCNKSINNKTWLLHYYTLSKLLENSVEKCNRYIKEIVETFIRNYENDVDLLHIVRNASDIIEKNPNLLKYSDITLYDHQKEIFNAVKSLRSKLILYIAPTGTGKTLTPLGLSEKHKVIFVCAARHVGLALARSAISINKRIAFAFGCSAAEDVRLHYFAAKEYTKDKRSGNIKKVDNTVGDKVDIIICDIRSYLPAMYYMASFNPIETIITYWDEPTITMDYPEHELHAIIKKNWKKNIIPNFVLSSATLPKMNELTQTIADFSDKFPNAEIVNIVSHDCRKTIPLINNNGFVVMPHYLHEKYDDILEIVRHCEENLTLLRYFDLKEACEFVHYIQINEYNKGSSKFDRNFASIEDIDMKSIKMYYLKVLKNIIPAQWSVVYEHFKTNRVKRLNTNNTIDAKGNVLTKSSKSGSSLVRTNSIHDNKVVADSEPPGSSGVYITTKDSYTLKDGPTIFIANDLQKIARFCIQQASIPSLVMREITEKIQFNNQINARIDEIEKELEFEEKKVASKLGGSSSDNSKEAKNLQGKKSGKSSAKIANKLIDKTDDRKIAKMREDVSMLRGMIKNATIDDMFIPNKLTHLEKWARGLNTTNAFTSDIDESTIVSIMSLNNVDDSWKILLLLGIGVFTEHKSSAYTEIMKKLADQQRLYLIIADSDYIYGTNYQFCHGYLSKDLELTQEKIIQALGRIGRNNIQQEYSARFRDDNQITTLFTNFAFENKPEVINMNQLFNSKNVKWNGVEYEEFPDEEMPSLFQDEDENEDDDEDEYQQETVLSDGEQDEY